MKTALLRGHLDVVNLLMDFPKRQIRTQIRTQIREGFELSDTDGSLYVPLDIINMIIEFAI